MLTLNAVDVDVDVHLMLTDVDINININTAFGMKCHVDMYVMSSR